jgi:alpha-tubulin suppressor-like RCC1 family protein
MPVKISNAIRALLLADLVLASGVAQSSVRGWGVSGFDTEARRGARTHIDATDMELAELRSDGRLFVSGHNHRGAVLVPRLEFGLFYVDVSIAHNGGAAIVSDGTIRTWGRSVSSPTPTLSPTPQLPQGLSYIDVDRTAHALALRSDGAVIAWGQNNHGQCNVPALPPSPVIQVFAESNASYVRLADGSLIGWGQNDWGQTNIPTPPPGVGYVSIDHGTNFALAIRTDGECIAWGSNQWGELNVPALPPGTTYQLAAGGYGRSYAYRSDGVIVAWGTNVVPEETLPPLLPSGASCVQLVAGFRLGAALLSDGTVLRWGYPLFDVDYVGTSAPLTTPGGLYVDVARGYEHTLTLTYNGEVQAWGNNLDGQASVPSWLQAAAPWKIATHAFHSAALLASGQMAMWGNNTVGQCSVPALPPGVSYVDVALGGGHTLAVRSDGAAVAFGTSQTGATQIPALPHGVTYIQADAEYERSALLRSDGDIVSWGATFSIGQHSTPPLATGLRYTKATVGRYHTAALRSDGQVIWWGSLSTSGLAGRPLQPLPWGVYAIDCDSGFVHTTLLRSDGAIDTFGTCLYLEDVSPELQLGESYVQISTNGQVVAGRVGPTSTYVGVAPGCAGSMQAGRLVPRDTPKIGRTFGMTMFDLPANVAMLAMSFQRLPQPLDLAFLGIPGCTWQIPLDAVGLFAGQNNQARFDLAIPSTQSLVGIRFYNQALVLDPAAGNGFGAVVSDAAEGVVGRP